MVTNTVVVLGGGIGGVVAARGLRRHLPAEDRVVVVESDPTFRFAPSFLWVMAGDRRPDQVSRDLRRLRRRGIEIVEGTVEGIDADTRTVATTAGPVDFDRLVVALGADLDPGALTGFGERAHNIYTLDGAEAAGEALRHHDEGPVAVVVGGMPYKCPAAPWEAALAADAILRRRGVRERCPLHLFTPEPAPMPVAGAEVGAAVIGLLAERGIEIHTGTTVSAIEPDVVRLADGETVAASLVLGIPPHRPPAVLSDSGLTTGGYLSVDPATLETDQEGISAVGDVTAITLPGGKMLPKAGVFAEREAHVAARRISTELVGDTPDETFDGRGSCFVELGDGTAGYAGGGFYDPTGPSIELRGPGRRWHLAKAAYEQWWLRRWL